MKEDSSYKIYFIGDSSVTIDFGNFIDEEVNKKVISLYELFNKSPLVGTTDMLCAYSSLTIFYNLIEVRKKIPKSKKPHQWIEEELQQFLRNKISVNETKERIVSIPVCYDREFGIDLFRLAELNKMTMEEIIQLHLSKSYRVYMIGFLPGFAYMGEVDDRIAAPRKMQPQNVVPGSVGIAGKQTGIYPFASPGGWQIIGRTPLQIFNPVKDPPCLLFAGDRVHFFKITRDEFDNYQSRNF